MCNLVFITFSVTSKGYPLLTSYMYIVHVHVFNVISGIPGHNVTIKPVCTTQRGSGKPNAITLGSVLVRYVMIKPPDTQSPVGLSYMHVHFQR